MRLLPIPGSPHTSHHLAVAAPRERPKAQQQPKFLLASHQRRQAATAALGIEPAFRCQSMLDAPEWTGSRDPLQVMVAEIRQFERIADQSA